MHVLVMRASLEILAGRCGVASRRTPRTAAQYRPFASGYKCTRLPEANAQLLCVPLQPSQRIETHHRPRLLCRVVPVALSARVDSCGTCNLQFATCGCQRQLLSDMCFAVAFPGKSSPRQARHSQKRCFPFKKTGSTAGNTAGRLYDAMMLGSDTKTRSALRAQVYPGAPFPSRFVSCQCLERLIDSFKAAKFGACVLLEACAGGLRCYPSRTTYLGQTLQS